VWARGIDGRAIFRAVGDQRDLVARFCEVFPAGGARCLAWTLMSNHLHAVVRSGPASISELMRRIHTGFALRFNLRYGRQGYLFQGRFGSRIVRDDGGLLAVICYVLRNPLEARLVPSLAALERFPWSAYGALLGVRPALPFESVEEALAAFGPDPATARAALRSWMEVGADLPDPPALKRPGPEPPLAGLIREVCREFGVSERELRAGRRSRPVSLARAELCRRAILQRGARAVAVARALGVSESAVSQALRRGPHVS
jgi:REP element-mobilizing transposase RayT